MIVEIEFNNSLVPEEREAVETGQLPIQVHGVTVSLAPQQRQAGSQWPVIRLEGPADIVMGLLFRGGYQEQDSYTIIER